MALTAKMLQMFQNNLTTILKRSVTYKSAISLETLYPNSTLKITTPSISKSTDTTEKFSGYIPLDKLDIKYSGSSGPGGQNVNKVHTKVDLRFKLAEAEWIHPDIKNKLAVQFNSKLTKEGYLVIRSDATRSQQLNLADCMRKLRALIWEATPEKKEPSPETQEMIRKRHLKAARIRVTMKREEALKRQMRSTSNIDL